MTIVDRDGDGVKNDIDNCPAAANPGQVDSDLNGIGNTCQRDDLLHSTAAFLEAGLAGGTVTEPVGLAVTEEPDLVEKLVRIVDFRVREGLTDSADTLTENLVDGLVEAGLLPAEVGEEIVAAVLQRIDSDMDGVLNADDACPQSDLSESVEIDGCAVEGVNILGANGCTTADDVEACRSGARNHGAFVSCIAAVTNRLVAAGFVTGAEKGRIEGCAARSSFP